MKTRSDRHPRIAGAATLAVFLLAVTLLAPCAIAQDPATITELVRRVPAPTIVAPPLTDPDRIIDLAMLGAPDGIPGPPTSAPPQDPDQTTELRGLPEQGDPVAQAQLGAMYLRQNDQAEAVKWFRLAAEQGWAPAQLALGTLYGAGRGVLKDAAEAMRWYRLAAEQGHVGWQAVASRAGGTPESLLAAEQGLAMTQYNLGVGYFLGRGVLKNAAEAARWYRLAAEQGHAEAQGSLGLMYAMGHVLPQQGFLDHLTRFFGETAIPNYVIAHMWLNIAGANGDDNARTAPDGVERDMTRAEISRATELARTCMDSDYRNCGR